MLSSPARRPGDSPAMSLESARFLFPGILGINCQVLVARGLRGGLRGRRPERPAPGTAGATTDRPQAKAQPIGGGRGAPEPIGGACGASENTFKKWW